MDPGIRALAAFAGTLLGGLHVFRDAGALREAVVDRRAVWVLLYAARSG